ncbi:hypothetical protein CDEST_02035 [Colletotrichum destructivum]|uniref:Uncharacterized protein n=1 Tax=Colletotrichum destructivum TaxID=34406 RepID=A0AAX4I1Q8_9PEZI|nr:hypothetical protein CDEST_02035 [Colletotrichum destructivum]
MFDVGRQDVFEMEDAGNEVQTAQSKAVSDWRVVDAKKAKIRKAQRFLRQVSLRMRLAARQERLPLHRIAHQARGRSTS